MRIKKAIETIIFLLVLLVVILAGILFGIDFGRKRTLAREIYSTDARLSRIEILMNGILSKDDDFKFDLADEYVKNLKQLKQIEDNGERNPLFHYAPTWTKEGEEFNDLLKKAVIAKNFQSDRPNSPTFVKNCINALPNLSDRIQLRRKSLDEELIRSEIHLGSLQIKSFVEYNQKNNAFSLNGLFYDHYINEEYDRWGKYNNDNNTACNYVDLDIYKNFRVKNPIKWLYDKIQEQNANLPPEKRIAWPVGEPVPKD
jgi:hypothetical protein